MGTWPGETEIMDRWDWERGEAPTLEFTREYPSNVYHPVSAQMTMPDYRIVIERCSDILFPVKWSVEYWNGWTWSMCAGNTFPLGDEYGLSGFGWNEDRCLRKAKRKADALIRKQMRHSRATYAV